ncbi:MAG: dihydroorotate dehydrogenase electron transfer subunit [Microbacterium sp.]
MSSRGTSGLDGLVTLRPAEVVPRVEPTWEHADVVGHAVAGGRYLRLTLRSPEIAASAQAGQFVMVTVPGATGDRILLPRPMAIHRRRPAEGIVELIYNVIGRGTAALSEVPVGSSVLLTGPLGRGFEIPAGAQRLLLIGRGIGVCAVMGVAEDARGTGIRVDAVLSANTASSVIGAEDCAELGAEAIPVCDEDGSSSVQRLGELLRRRFAASPPDAIMVCGSTRLSRLAAELSAEWGVGAQVSLEAHMACGLGYCHGCAAPTAHSAAEEGPLVCVDGPVFDLLPADAGLAVAGAGR